MVDDFGLGAELHHMNRANAARNKPKGEKTEADESQAQHHDMMARLAANRNRNYLKNFITPAKPAENPQSK